MKIRFETKTGTLTQAVCVVTTNGGKNIEFKEYVGGKGVAEILTEKLNAELLAIAPQLQSQEDSAEPTNPVIRISRKDNCVWIRDEESGAEIHLVPEQAATVAQGIGVVLCAGVTGVVIDRATNKVTSLIA